MARLGHLFQRPRAGPHLQCRRRKAAYTVNDSTATVTAPPTTTAAVTRRGAEILDELARRERRQEPAPTVRELVDVLALAPSSTATVQIHLRNLRRAGLVTWQPCAARTLRLTDAGREAVAA